MINCITEKDKLHARRKCDVILLQILQQQVTHSAPILGYFIYEGECLHQVVRQLSYLQLLIFFVCASKEIGVKAVSKVVHGPIL